MMRRLGINDADVLREAWDWDEGRPAWYRQADRVFNRGTVGDFVAQLADTQRVFLGVWSERLEAVILAHHHGSGIVEGHLLARRQADTALITVAGRHTIYELLDCGLTHAIVWVAERNIGVRRLCVNIGFEPDGVVMWRGSYHGRVIKWVRHSIRREQLLMDVAA
jgi:hypothetical protein